MAAAFYWRALKRAGCEIAGSMDIVNRWNVTHSDLTKPEEKFGVEWVTVCSKVPDLRQSVIRSHLPLPESIFTPGPIHSTGNA